MNTFKEMLNDTKVVIDAGILYDYKFYIFLNKNFDALKEANKKLLLHKSALNVPVGRNNGNLIMLQNNNLIELYGSEDFGNICHDTLHMLISKSTKERITFISKNFRLCKNADQVNNFMSTKVLGIEPLTLDLDGSIRKYQILDYNYIEQEDKYENNIT